MKMLAYAAANGCLRILTLAAESGGSAKSSGSGNVGIALALFVLIVLRGWRIGMRYNKRQYATRKPYVRRERVRIQPRHDDGEFPSGFGGPGSIRDVFSEDTDEKTSE